MTAKPTNSTMQKELENMKPEELGRLFPVILVPPDPAWREMFIAEKNKIENIPGAADIISIEHIGSTAVPGLLSKPTIDILVQAKESADNEKIIRGFRSIDYHYIHRPENPAPHMMFAKGYTTEGFRGQAYHVHVRYRGDWDEIYFRDYLVKNPGVASGYAVLKQELAEKYKNDREAYTDAKTNFVNSITALARKEIK